MDSTEAMRLTDTGVAARARTRDVVEFDSPSRADAISRIRARVRDFARSMPFTTDDLDDICIAVGEAATNAVKHGHNPASPRICIRMERSPNALRVLISDTGHGFDPSKVCPPGIEDLCECGRGIMCMCALMDEVRFQPMEPGTRVELVKYARG